MLTMNTAKVKKSKKIKSSTVNEHDESVLEFEVSYHANKQLMSVPHNKFEMLLTDFYRHCGSYEFLVGKHCEKIFIKTERNFEKEKS